MQEHLRILLVYKSHNLSIQQFREYILHLVNSKNPDILLGDFNINALQTPAPSIVTDLYNENYALVVTKPTHIKGNLIDHIYISNSLISMLDFEITTVTIYYSDHAAVSLRFL